MAISIATSCTSDYEVEKPSSTSKVNEIRMKIMEMANDYGLKIRIDERSFNENFDKVNIDTLDKIMKSIVAVKGTYQLKSQKTNNGYKAVQGNRKKTRTANRTVHNYYYEFGKEEYKEGNFTIDCFCEIHWKEDSTGIHDIDVSSYAVGNEFIGSTAGGGYGSYDNKTNRINVNGSIGFGSIGGTLCIDIYFSGYYNVSDETNNITWY